MPGPGPLVGGDLGPYAHGVDARRVALLQDIDAWLTSARALEQVLVDNAVEVRKGRDMVADGVCLSEAIATLSTTDRYLRMRDALADFEMTRFTLRSSLISAALAEGLTLAQLVEVLGVPAELTARVLDELTTDGE
jgi:hypothetical protein